MIKRIYYLLFSHYFTLKISVALQARGNKCIYTQDVVCMTVLKYNSATVGVRVLLGSFIELVILARVVVSGTSTSSSSTSRDYQY